MYCFVGGDAIQTSFRWPVKVQLFHTANIKCLHLLWQKFKDLLHGPILLWFLSKSVSASKVSNYIINDSEVAVKPSMLGTDTIHTVGELICSPFKLSFVISTSII